MLKGKCIIDKSARDISYIRRKIWEDKLGSVPVQCFVVSKCKTKRCINKNHLSLETNVDHEHMSKNRIRHTSSKLTDKQVEDIRDKYKHHGDTQQELAIAYGVSQRCICLIVRGQTYKKVING